MSDIIWKFTQKQKEANESRALTLRRPGLVT